MKDRGSTTVELKVERQLGHSGTPCEGYYSLVEYKAKDSTRRINCPRMFDLLVRALGDDLPEFGSEIVVTVSVEVVKRAKKSTKKCHNPWPAHRCRKP